MGKFKFAHFFLLKASTHTSNKAKTINQPNKSEKQTTRKHTINQLINHTSTHSNKIKSARNQAKTHKQVLG